MKNSTHGMKNNTQGFTLIELLIVIAIIGILAAVLIPNVLNARKRANDTANNAFAGQVATWIAAADTGANDATKQAALKAVTSCTATLLQDEGAPAALPAAVDTCTIAYAAGTGRYTITSKSTNAVVVTKTY